VRRAACLLVLTALTACGDDPSPADERAEQLRSLAEDEGLGDDVAEVLELAARGIDATFQVSYPGEEGTSIVVSQSPPNRRVDVVAGQRILESRVVRDDVGYHCAPPPDDPGGQLDCTRRETTLDAPGAFTEQALEAFAGELAETGDEVELRVEERTIAGVPASCLVAAPARGSPETICFSDEGAQLLLDTAGERVEADAYTTDVPEGTFDT
jgi:hypothetical protein